MKRLIVTGEHLVSCFRASLNGATLAAGKADFGNGGSNFGIRRWQLWLKRGFRDSRKGVATFAKGASAFRGRRSAKSGWGGRAIRWLYADSQSLR